MTTEPIITHEDARDLVSDLGGDVDPRSWPAARKAEAGLKAYIEQREQADAEAEITKAFLELLALVTT